MSYVEVASLLVITVYDIYVFNDYAIKISFIDQDLKHLCTICNAYCYSVSDAAFIHFINLAWKNEKVFVHNDFIISH